MANLSGSSKRSDGCINRAVVEKYQGKAKAKKGENEMKFEVTMLEMVKVMTAEELAEKMFLLAKQFKTTKEWKDFLCIVGFEAKPISK